MRNAQGNLLSLKVPIVGDVGLLYSCIPFNTRIMITCSVQDTGKMFEKLGWYFSTILLGLFIQGCIILPLLYTILIRELPFR